MIDDIAIIGGAGFVGTRTANRLKKALIKFSVYDINQINSVHDPIYLDVESKDFSNIIDPNTKTIVNLAAVHRDDIKPITRYYDVNVNGAKNVCNVARKNNINRIIFTSSVAVYGFAPSNTDECGEINYFNEYGRTKYLAENIYKDWFNEDPSNRTLIIIRPTVIFGEGNRGNVYNLLNQINSKKFAMFGNGKNKKSMAYVENVAAFIEFCSSIDKGQHIFNYIDKEDFNMKSLVTMTRKEIFNKNNQGFALPAFLGIALGYLADFLSKLIRKPLPVSSIRVKKFMSTTTFSSSVKNTGFKPPVKIENGLIKTIRYEFMEDNSSNITFDTE